MALSPAVSSSCHCPASPTASWLGGSASIKQRCRGFNFDFQRFSLALKKAGWLLGDGSEVLGSCFLQCISPEITSQCPC